MNTIDRIATLLKNDVDAHVRAKGALPRLVSRRLRCPYPGCGSTLDAVARPHRFARQAQLFVYRFCMNCQGCRNIDGRPFEFSLEVHESVWARLHLRSSALLVGGFGQGNNAVVGHGAH